MMKISLSRPDHPDDPNALLATLREILLSGRWTEGEFAASFEQRVAELCGSVYAVAANSGTSALEMILKAAGLGPEAEVICPSYTFIATVNAVLAAGATPVFADIDLRTYNLDLKSVDARVTKKTKAVLLVHQFGIPADGQAFAAFCKERNLILIEDAACGLGSKFNGKALGTFGIAGLLSFHPRKVLSTGEGGMVITDNEVMAVKARLFGSHGRLKGSPADSVGHNYRMSEFQAALGLWALERLREGIDRRITYSKIYDTELSQMDGLALTREPGRGDWNRQSYPIRISGERREAVADQLRRRGIETSPGPLPAHIHPYIVALLHPPRLPHTETAYEETLLLPMYAALGRSDTEQVIEALRDALT